MILTACVLAASGRGVTLTERGSDLDFRDLTTDSVRIERAAGRWGKYSFAGVAAGGKFVDTASLAKPFGYYYRIVNMAGEALDTLSADETLFGPDVIFYSPDDEPAAVARSAAGVHERLFGSEMDSVRYALMFKPGDYREAGLINVPFYVHAGGLGRTPYEVKLSNVHTPPHLSHGNGTCTFWRSIENVSVCGPETYNEPETFKWAVSQAAPMRRVHSERTMRSQWGNGWVSGGYAADCRFEAPAGSDHQQQWYTRNSVLEKGRGEFREEKYNYCFQGVELGDEVPQGAYANNWDTGGNVTFLPVTPVVREKPFLCVGDDGRYKVFVPALMRNSKGVSYTETDPGDGVILDVIDMFTIVRPGMTAAEMNNALSKGRNLLITPGMYELEEPLRVERDGAVILGLGWATLIPGAGNGDCAIEIGDVEGATVASLLFDAHYSSEALLRAGREVSDKRHAENPVLLADLFFRVGGFRAAPVHVDRAVEINSNDVIGDHFWIWRADHGVPGSVGWDVNTARNGLVVNGSDVTVYGLFNEHFQEYQTLWNGENGRMFFYQCETPYDAPEQKAYMSESGSRAGWAAYKVGDGVKRHFAAALGIYDVLNNEIMIENSVEVPDAEGVNLFHVCNNSLSDGERRGFNYVINGMKKSTYDTYRDNTVRVNDYREEK